VSDQWGSTQRDDGATQREGGATQHDEGAPQHDEGASFGTALDRLRAARDHHETGSPAHEPGDGDATALADDLRARLAERRETTAAARYSAAAYAAVHGHVPGGAQEELDPGGAGRRRWALRPRTGVIAASAVLLLGAGLAVAASWPGDDVQALAAVSGPDGSMTKEAAAGGAASGGMASGGTASGGAPSRGAGTVASSGGNPAGVADPALAIPAPTGVPGVVVDVVGKVRTPGLVTLPAGSRVADAVAAAGGATEEAELSAVNLARPLVDGEQLRIPAPGEVVAPAPGADVGAGAGATGGAASGTAATGTGAGMLVNLNTADAVTLETLPGVGPALAGRIVEWREQNGAFASVDELDEVSGIGPAMLAKVRDLVTV